MSDLTIAELKEKIAMVDKDIIRMQSQGQAGRGVEALTEYKAYLEDEIRFLRGELERKLPPN